MPKTGPTPDDWENKLHGNWKLIQTSNSKELGIIKISADKQSLTWLSCSKFDDICDMELATNSPSDAPLFRGECSNWGCAFGIEYEVVLSLISGKGKGGEGGKGKNTWVGRLEVTSEEEDGPSDATGRSYKLRLVRA